MANKTLSVFIDESGDFGKYDPKSPYYYVSMVLHDQSIDISSEIANLEERVANFGYPHHAIHVGPIIRREKVYEHDLMENRKSLFNALFHFTRKTNIYYLCAKINKGECEDSEMAYIARISRAISDELKDNIDFFNSYDLIINYYDYGQSNLTKIITTVFTTLFNNVELRKVQPADYKLFQVADLICTLELTKDKADKNELSNSEKEFFGSVRDFKKNIYKQIEKKKLHK
ncbi:MAG: DUF3800 domain-containing protein [Treponema sp.]|nr:DUF3800 domain-containing protein [Treponema sp.]